MTEQGFIVASKTMIHRECKSFPFSVSFEIVLHAPVTAAGILLEYVGSVQVHDIESTYRIPTVEFVVAKDK